MVACTGAPRPESPDCGGLPGCRDLASDAKCNPAPGCPFRGHIRWRKTCRPCSCPASLQSSCPYISASLFLRCPQVLHCPFPHVAARSGKMPAFPALPRKRRPAPTTLLIVPPAPHPLPAPPRDRAPYPGRPYGSRPSTAYRACAHRHDNVFRHRQRVVNRQAAGRVGPLPPARMPEHHAGHKAPGSCSVVITYSAIVTGGSTWPFRVI